MLPKTFGDTLNSFFDQIYVITLPHSYQRQREAGSNLRGLGINFSFIEGVNGKALDLLSLSNSVYDNDLAIKRTGNPLTPGELGCSLSVLKICQKVVEEKLSKVLIMQDDMQVIAENTKYADRLLSSAPDDWDLLYLLRAY